jgi:hypothetical protein
LAYRQKKCGTTKEEMGRTVLEESWRRNGPVGPSLEVIDDYDLFVVYSTMLSVAGPYSHL